MSHFERTLPISPAGRAGHRLETFRAPAELGGANGIRIGPDGRLWICEALMQRIASCDTRTGEITTVIARDGSSLIAPDDLAVDAEGSAYITDSNRITVRRPDGTVSTLTDGLTAANGITVDSGGHLYANEFMPGGRIMEIDRHSGETRVIVASADFPNACAKGPDGRLYYQNVGAGTVFAADVDSGEVEQVASGFHIVPSVRWSPDGRFHVAESISGLVNEVDLATGDRRVVATMPLGGIDNFVFDADGTMYVSSYTTGCILKVPPGAGAEPEILVPPGLVNIASIAPMPDGSVMVATMFNIPLVATDGSVGNWSAWVASEPHYLIPAAWPIDNDHAHVLLSDGRVVRCKRGQTAAEVMAAAAADPSVIVVGADATALGGDGHGGLLVGMSNGEVRRFAADGWQALTAATGLGTVTAVTAADGVVAAADAAAGSVALIRGGEVSVLTGFARPTGVALSAGALYVAEHQARRVVRCDLEAGTREVVAADLPFGWPVPEPPPVGTAPLAAVGDGVILIGCDGDGSIRRLTAPGQP